MSSFTVSSLFRMGVMNAFRPVILVFDDDVFIVTGELGYVAGKC
jgi:hypothetical protein